MENQTFPQPSQTLIQEFEKEYQFYPQPQPPLEGHIGFGGPGMMYAD